MNNKLLRNTYIATVKLLFNVALINLNVLNVMVRTTFLFAVPQEFISHLYSYLFDTCNYL